MNYSTSFCLILFSFFLGISLGCFFSILCGKIFRRHYLGFRFSLGCIFLSFAVVSFSVMIIFLPESHNLKFFTRSDVYFWLVVCLLGCLISSFWKFLLIPAFLIFLFVWGHSYLFLNKYFGSANEKKVVSVQKSSVIVDDRFFQGVPEGGRNILLKVYCLPRRLVLPLPRFWTRYTVVTDKQIAEDDDYSRFFEKGDFELENKKNMIQEWFQLFDYWLLNNQEYIVVPIPDSKAYPVLYSFIADSSMDKLYVKLKKDL